MKKILPLFMAFAMSALTLTGCSSSPAPETSSASTNALETAASEEKSQAAQETAPTDARTAEAAVRVGSLKGPTSMGLVSLMNSEKGAKYEFNMVTAADELVAAVASGQTDIALLPANVASVLYNKTYGGVSVIDINTLGVLYIVSADDSIQSVADLKGKTLYLTGKGTTPDYVARYLIAENGLTTGDVTLEYKSEPTEVAAVLKEKSDAIGLLPQPFVTAACAQNENLHIVLDLTEEWDKLQSEGGSRMVTGVTIVRREFLTEHEEAVKTFMADHKASAEFAYANLDETAEWIAEAGIIEKAPIAKKALPYCNITYIDGEEMKSALSGYLSVLFEQNPASVGGALPGDDFYYGAE